MQGQILVLPDESFAVEVLRGGSPKILKDLNLDAPLDIVEEKLFIANDEQVVSKNGGNRICRCFLFLSSL